MLIQLMMLPMWGLITLLINLFPVIESFPTTFGAVTNIIGYGCAIIGTDFFLSILGNIIFWLSVQLSWALIEWIYKKIPGLN